MPEHLRFRRPYHAFANHHKKGLTDVTPEVLDHDGRRTHHEIRLEPSRASRQVIFRIVVFLAATLPSILKAQQTPATPPSPAEAIPLTQIALRGEQLSRTLRDISRRLPL